MHFINVVFLIPFNCRKYYNLIHFCWIREVEVY